MSSSLREIVATIPAWLTVTGDREVSIGLSHEEARGRAVVLRRLLRQGTVQPGDVVLDEELKDVFYALVDLATVEETASNASFVAEANAIYQFLDRVKWLEDDFNEKRDLLRRLGEAGWRALGEDVEVLARRRARLEDGVALRELGDNPLSSRSDALVPRVASLIKSRNFSPSAAYSEAVTLFSLLNEAGPTLGLFDERDYLMGSVAFSAGAAVRHLGRLDEAQEWFAIAARLFSKTFAPAPLVAITGYGRLCLLFERDEYDRVLKLEPDVRESLRQAEMHSFLRKCEFVRAKSLRILGRKPQARALFESLRGRCALARDHSLESLVLICLADLVQEEGKFEYALELLQRAGALQDDSDYAFANAELEVVLGDLLRKQGKLVEAISAFRSAVAKLRRLGMARWEAYSRLLLAETLLACDRAREAETELLQALPTMASLRIVPEGLTAVALLQESLRRQKVDPEALRAVREHLQKHR